MLTSLCCDVCYCAEMSESSSSSTKKSVRNCLSCKIRMSSSEVDPHVVCVNCRGVECNQQNRCDVCSPWPEGKMAAYLKHQASLERKRRSKKKAKESHIPDFATICTGVQDTDVILSDDGLSRGGGGDSASSVAISAQSQNIDSLVTSKFVVLSQDLRTDLRGDMDRRDENILKKLEVFGQNMFDLVHSIKDKGQKRSRDSSPDDDDITNRSFPAPRQVPGRRPSRRLSPPLSDDPIGSDNQDLMRDGPVPDGNIDSPPSLSPEALKSLDYLDQLFDQGLLAPDAYSELRAKVFAKAADGQDQGDQGCDQGTQTGGDQGPQTPHPDEQVPPGDGVGQKPRSTGAGIPSSPLRSEPDSELGTGGVNYPELFELICSLFDDARGESDRTPAPSYLRGSSVIEYQAPCRLSLYDRLARVKDDIIDRLKKEREFKKPSTILQKRRSCYRPAGVDATFSASNLNDNFNRITKSKASSNVAISIPCEELRKFENAVAGLQDAQSFASWLVNTVLAYVRLHGFVPPNEPLWDRLSSSLSLAMVDQARASFSFTAFSTLCRRAHFLKFAAPTITDGQKHRLLTTNPFDSTYLFDPNVLNDVITEYEGAAATTSHLDLSKALAKGLFWSKKKEDPKSSSTGPASAATSASNVPASQASNPSPFNTRGYYRGRGGRKGKGPQKPKGGSSSQKSGANQTFQK